MARIDIGACPVCKYEDASSQKATGDTLDVHCERCGDYRLSFEASLQLIREGANHRLCAWLRSGALHSQTSGLLTTHVLERLPDVLPDYSVADRLDLLLDALASRSKRPGDHVQLAFDFDYPLAWASSAAELRFYLETLRDRGVLVGAIDSDSSAVGLTADGWQRIDDRRRRPATSDQAFVAMWFSDEMTLAWLDGIAPAVVKTDSSPTESMSNRTTRGLTPRSSARFASHASSSPT